MTRYETTTPTAKPATQEPSPKRAKVSRRRSSRKRRHSANAYLAVAGSLGSARDRQHLRERNAAERIRVERMLAESPGSVGARSTTLRVVPPVAARGCPVCASTKVVSDEVAHSGRHAGTLRLSECLHCDHRWTERTRGRWTELGGTMGRAVRWRAATPANARG